ncbi:Protein kinase domain-containing protein [Entamoeba marina]
MSLSQESPQHSAFTIELNGTDEEKSLFQKERVINLGRLETDQLKKLDLKITCFISKVKVVCEQETNEQEINVRENEVETNFVNFQTASTMNLKINFRAKRGRIVNLIMKVEKLKGNKTHSNEELQSFEQRIQLKYQKKLSHIDSIPENAIKIIKKIGEGGEATVYKAIYDDEIVAIKTYKQNYGIEESEKMLHFKNNYIVEYKKSFYREINDEECFCSMLEYVEHGSLDDVKGRIEIYILYKIFEDVCKALKYLHEVKDVIHRDIKPQNILIINCHENRKVNAKLTDFGTCDIINYEGNNGIVGTPYFTAPEIKGGNYTKKCDIYSLGITMLVSFLKIDLKSMISDIIQPNGTYITNITNIMNLKSDIRNLIIKCCQIDTSKRPNINECLNSIQGILRTFGDKEIFQTMNVEELDFKYSLPKFDLLESLKEIVQSIKELKVTNEFIKAKIMLKFKNNIKEAITLMNSNRTLFDNKGDGDGDYALAQYYIETNEYSSINKGYELMMDAARKSHPDAIMYLINILIDIVDGKITIHDEEKNQICEIINEIYDLGILQNKSEVYSTREINNNSISKTNVINIFSVLKKYLPICEFQYGIALLHGIVINKNVIEAQTMFNSFKQSGYCKDPQEIDFYLSYCKFIKNSPDTYKEAHYLLDGCIMYSENQYYYSYALNNKSVLLYKGLGCEKDINKAIEYFEKSMKLNNDYGKFNHTFCSCGHKTKFSSESISEDDIIKIIEILAHNGLDVAQQFCAQFNYKKYENDNRDVLLQESIYWVSQASLQLDCDSVYNLGFFLRKWSEKQDENKRKKCEEKFFNLFNIASHKGFLKAQFNLINCYWCGIGTEKNLEEAKNLCIKALKNSEDDELVDEEWKIKVYIKYLSILKEISSQNKDLDISGDVKELIETLKNINNPKTNFELYKCYYVGILVEKDINEAIEYLKKAASQNHPNSLFELGVIYSDEKYVKRDMNKAIDYYEKAANLNHSTALFNLGVIYQKGNDVRKDINKAIDYYERAAKLNNPYALNNLDIIYQKGNDVKKDINKAIQRSEKTSSQNDLNTLYQLGLMYLKGNGIEKNINNAIECLEEAANLNHSDALFELGLIYQKGFDVRKDINKAMQYYEKAVNLNHTNALNNLGAIYYDGKYLKKDVNKAIEYFEKAANLGHPKALFNLGNICLNRDGVKRDINKLLTNIGRSITNSNY